MVGYTKGALIVLTIALVHSSFVESTPIDRDAAMPKMNNFLFQAQILSMSNPGNVVSSNKCSNSNCTCTSPNFPNYCSMDVVITISTYKNTITKLLKQNANKNGSMNTPSSIYKLGDPTKPVEFSVLALGSGNVFSKKGGNIVSSGPSLVDQFAVSLEQMTPVTATFNGSMFQNTFNGSVNGAQLTIGWLFQCVQPNMTGANCDMTCNPSGACTQMGTKAPFSCTYVNGSDPNQFGNCQMCSSGVNVQSGACNPPTAPPPTNPSKKSSSSPFVNTSLVAKSYKTSTIALAICFAIAVVIIIMLVVRTYMEKKKKDQSEYSKRRNEWREKSVVELNPDAPKPGNGARRTASGSEASEYENKAYNPNLDAPAKKIDDSSDSSEDDEVSNYSKATEASAPPPPPPHDSNSMASVSLKSSRPGSRQGHQAVESNPDPDHSSEQPTGRVTPRIEVGV